MPFHERSTWKLAPQASKDGAAEEVPFFQKASGRLSSDFKPPGLGHVFGGGSLCPALSVKPLKQV